MIISVLSSPCPPMLSKDLSVRMIISVLSSPCPPKLSKDLSVRMIISVLSLSQPWPRLKRILRSQAIIKRKLCNSIKARPISRPREASVFCAVKNFYYQSQGELSKTLSYTCCFSIQYHRLRFCHGFGSVIVPCGSGSNVKLKFLISFLDFFKPA